MFLGREVEEATRFLNQTPGAYIPEAWASGGSRAVLMGLPLGRISAGEREQEKTGSASGPHSIGKTVATSLTLDQYVH